MSKHRGEPNIPGTRFTQGGALQVLQTPVASSLDSPLGGVTRDGA